mmetsp:Transcript_7508/g.30974  ORF Transcript_7508/g.30974 Transcript_7508/m.30974 type:complete len:294 (-) Transcript_7508:211-1092(-)
MSTVANLAGASRAVVSTRGASHRASSHRRVTRAVPASSAARTTTIRCGSDEGSSARQQAPKLDRRALLTAAAALAAAAPLALEPAGPARAAFDGSDSKMVGAYLPAGPDGLYVFEARAPRTPALRAGALEPYSILLPPEFKEAPVSNARSGNYCQPRCDEATTEVQFVEPSAGSLQIIIIPTTKLLIAKQDPSVEDVGTIDGILNAISPAITGSVAAEPEEVVASSTKVKDGRSYYEYELLTPFAEFGLHSVSAVSTNKNYVMIATIAASEKQWAKSEADLKKVIDSFRVYVK